MRLVGKPNALKNKNNMKSKVGKKTNPYGDWLQNFSWTYWCTFTTAYTLTLPSARRLMYRMFDMRVNSDKNSQKLIETQFWAAEPFDTRYGYHTHALVEVTPDLPVTVKMFCEAYQVAAGNVTIAKDQWHRVQVQKFNPKLGASHYCGKYITKHLADYDIWKR